MTDRSIQRQLLVLLLCLIVSAVLAESFRDAWSGADGWMMGLLVQGCAVSFAVYFACGKQNAATQWNEFSQGCFYIGTGLVVVFGICNRFRIYPFTFMSEDGSFLSTIGNINWLCGYLSVAVPMAMGELYLCREKELCQSNPLGSGKTILRALFTELSFLLIILQGAETGYLILAVSFAVLFVISIKNRERMMAFLEQMAMACALPAFLHLCITINIQIFDSYLWEDSRHTVNLIYYWYKVPLRILVVCLIGWMLLNHSRKQRLRKTASCGTEEHSVRCEKYDSADHITQCWGQWQQKTLKIMGGLCLATAVTILLVQLTGILPEEFGSMRGLIWKVCANLYKKLPLIQKIVGVGPDCLYSYLLQHEEYRDVLLSNFGMDVMNAHSVLLQRLVTTGLAGTIGYLAVLLVFIRKMSRWKQGLPYYMMLLSYVAVGTVMFEQIVNFPMMMLLVGIGAGDICCKCQDAD